MRIETVSAEVVAEDNYREVLPGVWVSDDNAQIVIVSQNGDETLLVQR